jgi:hypothetical protein
MAQTRRKRRRKHRGTPAGTIERSGRTGAPRTRQEAKQIARRRREERLTRQPSWRGAATRAAVAALLFGVLVVVAFHRDLEQAAILTVFVFLIYIPLGYLTDQLIWRIRGRRRARAGK